MQHLAHLNVLVLGLGESGLAMARWARRCGAARIVVADTRESPPQAMQLAADVPQAELHTGGFELSLLDGIQLLLKSPGLSPLDAQLAPLLARADELGIGVRGELSLFASALADLKAARGYAPKVLAITGTNGKTTTTALTALLVERTGVRVAMAGNIGPTLLDTLGAALDLEPLPLEAAADGAVEVPAEVPAVVPAEVPAEPVTEAPEDVPAAEPSATWPDVADEAELLPVQAAEVHHEASADDAPDAETPPADDEAVDVGGGPPPHLVPSPPPPPRFEHLPEVWVLELSSFQLDGVTNFEPSAAAVLNVTQDHLDWHGSMAAYAEAKARIYGHAERSRTVLVINHDDAQVEAMIPAPPAPPLGKGGKPLAKARVPKPVPRRVVRFGLAAPEHPGDFGLVVEGGMAWLVRAMETDETLARGKRAAAVEAAEIILQRLMPADALRIRGRHNAANALAALALATAVGLPLAPMLHGLREYRGEPHRVEFLGLVAGVEVYDDSKGTNVGATVAALDGLGSEKSPSRLVVILGGDGKGQDFTPLAAPVARHVRAAALIGRDAATIEAALASTGVPMQHHASLDEATRWAFEQAQGGDALLLSPACASLDMFRNYAHRAEVFAAAVRAIADARGEVNA